MNKLDYYSLCNILDFLNFEELCNLDIAYSQSNTKFYPVTILINDYYKTLLGRRNSFLNILCPHISLNKENYSYPYISKDLFSNYSTIAFLNKIPIKNFPKNLASLIFNHNFSFIGISRPNRELDKIRRIAKFKERYIIHDNFPKRKYFEINSKEAWLRIKNWNN